GVTQDVDLWVLDRSEQARGHLLAILSERRVNGRDDDVERREAVVGEIEGSVRFDVAFNTCEEPDAEAFRIDGPNAGRALDRAPLVQAVRHGQRPRVIGDGDVLQS